MIKEAEAFDTERTRALLETVRAAMEEFDVDSADAAMEELRRVRLPEALRGGMEKLETAMLDVDSDEVCRLAEELIGEVGNVQ